MQAGEDLTADPGAEAVDLKITTGDSAHDWAPAAKSVMNGNDSGAAPTPPRQSVLELVPSGASTVMAAGAGCPGPTGAVTEAAWEVR